MLYVRWKDRRIERNGLVIEKLRTFQGGNRRYLNIKAKQGLGAAASCFWLLRAGAGSLWLIIKQILKIISYLMLRQGTLL